MTVFPAISGQAAPAPAPTPQGQSAGGASGAVEASDFETFLTMLTTQIQNQDPLNPMQSSDFAVQLATFSGVEQQVQTNELLRSLGAGDSGTTLASHAGWVGMDARTDGTLRVDGATRRLHFDLPPGSVQADLVVTTPDGREVQRRAVTDETAPLDWAPNTETGGTLPAGDYNVALEAIGPTGRVETLPVSTYARVTEVSSGPDGVEVVLADGRRMPAAEITALRDG